MKGPESKYSPAERIAFIRWVDETKELFTWQTRSDFVKTLGYPWDDATTGKQLSGMCRNAIKSRAELEARASPEDIEEALARLRSQPLPAARLRVPTVPSKFSPANRLALIQWVDETEGCFTWSTRSAFIQSLGSPWCHAPTGHQLSALHENAIKARAKLAMQATAEDIEAALHRLRSQPLPETSGSELPGATSQYTPAERLALLQWVDATRDHFTWKTRSDHVKPLGHPWDLASTGNKLHSVYQEAKYIRDRLAGKAPAGEISAALVRLQGLPALATASLSSSFAPSSDEAVGNQSLSSQDEDSSLRIKEDAAAIIAGQRFLLVVSFVSDLQDTEVDRVGSTTSLHTLISYINSSYPATSIDNPGNMPFDFEEVQAIVEECDFLLHYRRIRNSFTASSHERIQAWTLEHRRQYCVNIAHWGGCTVTPSNQAFFHYLTVPVNSTTSTYAWPAHDRTKLNNLHFVLPSRVPDAVPVDELEQVVKAYLEDGYGLSVTEVSVLLDTARYVPQANRDENIRFAFRYIIGRTVTSCQDIAVLLDKLIDGSVRYAISEEEVAGEKSRRMTRLEAVQATRTRRRGLKTKEIQSENDGQARRVLKRLLSVECLEPENFMKYCNITKYFSSLNSGWTHAVRQPQTHLARILFMDHIGEHSLYANTVRGTTRAVDDLRDRSHELLGAASAIRHSGDRLPTLSSSACQAHALTVIRRHFGDTINWAALRSNIATDGAMASELFQSYHATAPPGVPRARHMQSFRWGIWALADDQWARTVRSSSEQLVFSAKELRLIRAFYQRFGTWDGCAAMLSPIIRRSQEAIYSFIQRNLTGLFSDLQDSPTSTAAAPPTSSLISSSSDPVTFTTTGL